MVTRMTSSILNVSVRMATPEDADLDAYDNTKLQAVNTCPTWGILRYQMHRVYSSEGRAMALEAGSAEHEVFAAVRLWQLLHYDMKDSQNRYDLFHFHGRRLFGDKFEAMLDTIKENGQDERTRCLNFCLQALYSSGFYDDPYDRRRTMSNLEEAAILYIDRWDFTKYPLWIRDRDDPESDVGIEIAFDVVVSFETVGGITYSYRFTGKLDGLHIYNDKMLVSENKTSSRLDEAWRQSFEMSSQVTGYMLAASVFTGQETNNGRVHGLQIPLPKSGDIGGLITEPVSREQYMFARWFDWFLYSVRVYERYREDPISAPKFTHSCNRYFRPCAFIPFCTSDDDEQRTHIEQMDIKEWSPLHDAGAKVND